MPVQVNPLNTQDWDYEYATDGTGSSWTAFGADDVVEVRPDRWARKVIERLLHNQDAVLKHLGKINYGNITVVLEYHSALFHLIQGWVQTRGQELWIRAEPNDTGGTNDSRVIFKGLCSEAQYPPTSGDDATALCEVTIALYDIDWTQAA